MSLQNIKAAIVLTLLGLLACGPAGIEPPPFNGKRAFSYLEDQVAFGPRVPGSEASAAMRHYCYEHFDEMGWQVDSQVSSFLDPYSQQQIPLVNVIAGFNGAGANADRIVLMAHYDCRPRADKAFDTTFLDQPIDGANDGASGVAVLMELAQLIAEKSPPCNIDLVLVDGEDWGKEGDHDYYCLGSREFSRADIRDRYRFGIVVDLVGDRDQRFYREGYSDMYNPDLNDMVWNAAADLGIDEFVDSVNAYIIDDHLSLNTAGVPTIDIIDIEYEFWHTEFDTPDKCSAEALSNVGRVLVKIIYDTSLWPRR